MINRQQLLNALKSLLKRIETDLRERAEAQGDAPEIHKILTTEYERARKAERTAATFEQWRSEQITQKAVAWILSCVFARFLEDNQLVDPPRIAGTKERLNRARDEHELYFKSNPTETDREYLLDGFAKLATLPGGREIFGEHNAIHVYPGWLSGDAAGELLTFFQTIDPGNGELIHDFTDEQWDTRFLGDLYQDLSEAARKKYALLQTPDFVEAFILDHTLEPALDEFGLNAPPVKNRNGDEIAPVGFRMIDPACGSGHFLLGAFDRIFESWLKTEPSANSRDLAQRTLSSIHGVDINPFAVAIARFRLLLKTMMACGVDKLKNCPAFELNLACGDSLLHGEHFAHQTGLPFEPVDHCYESEDFQELNKILKIGIYHTVVANPPYITVKDKTASQAYRKRYSTCYRKYSLAVPFMERIVRLAIQSGYTGQITTNSFMKREFGKKLVEDYFQHFDLSQVIDTSGAYIPGHGTPTVILFGRNRKPISQTVRCAMGIQSEPTTPAVAKEGQVWKSIIEHIDTPGSENNFISVSDVQRADFSIHPWNLGGGGIANLKTIITESCKRCLSDVAESIGFSTILAEDDAFSYPPSHSRILRLPFCYRRLYIIGEDVRDWQTSTSSEIVFPYDENIELVDDKIIRQFLWEWRTTLWGRPDFSRVSYKEKGRTFWEYHQIPKERNKKTANITYANVATYNHFSLVQKMVLFNAHAPIISLPPSAKIDQHLSLLGLLNCSAVCFWLRQSCHNKGRPGAEIAGADELWEQRFEFDNTKVGKIPLPDNMSYNMNLSITLNELSQKITPEKLNIGVFEENEKLDVLLSRSIKHKSKLIKLMVHLQEEIDWQSYKLYDLIDERLTYDGKSVELELGQRAFEIVMARKMAAGELETIWFHRHKSTPTTEIPKHWPEDYQQLVERRIKAIEGNPHTIGLIEKPEYKRRWNLDPWDSQLEKMIKTWLLDRLESYFDFAGRMNDEGTIAAKMDVDLTTTARLADISMTDDKFMEVAELYRKRPDFDVASLVEDLVDSESVPLLPACRYKDTGMDKRAAWERTWQLQRIEDAIDGLFDAQRLSDSEGDNLPQEYKDKFISIVNWLQANLPQSNNRKIKSLSPEEWLEKQVFSGLLFIQVAQEQSLDLDSGRVQHELGKLAKDVKNRLVGDIPVPPKYATKDFQNTTWWRLRGKLDVPKERWVSFPYCEGEDQSMVIAWAGYDHLQLAQAIAAHYVDIQERTGGSEDPRLEILLCCMMKLLPWVKQWHNDIDPDFNIRMGDYYQGFIADEARHMGKTIEEIQEWQPPKRTPIRRRKKQRQK